MFVSPYQSDIFPSRETPSGSRNICTLKLGFFFRVVWELVLFSKDSCGSSTPVLQAYSALVNSAWYQVALFVLLMIVTFNQSYF